MNPLNGDSPIKKRKHQDFERLLGELTIRFINISSGEVDGAIEDAQKIICQSMGVDRSILWLFNGKEQENIIPSYLYDTSGNIISGNILEIQKTCPWIFDQVRQGKTLAIEKTDTLPGKAAKDAGTLKKQGVKALCITPISEDNSVKGALSFCSFKEIGDWEKSSIETLQFIAQIFSNALSLKYQAEESCERLQFETLIADISARFVSLNAAQLDEQIERAQKAICQCLGIDLSALWQWSDTSPHYVTLTHLYSPPDGPERPDGIDAKEAFPWVLKRVLKGETLTIYTEDMPPEAARDQESRRFFGVKSSVVIPLCSGEDGIIGIISFDFLKDAGKWSEHIIDRLILVAQIFTNALARRRQELKLKENEKRLRLATQGAGIGLWVMDLESRYVWVTSRTRKIFNFEKNATLDYQSFMEKIVKEDKEKVDQAVQGAISSKETLETEYRIVHADDSIRWIKASGKVYCNDDGEPKTLMGISMDSTRQKKMEEQLRAHLEKINLLKQELEKENMHLQQRIEVQYLNDEIVSRSAEMEQILSQVEQVAPTHATVLIEGETGTGKELIARAIHRVSSRRDRLLVTVNCASLPPTLVESELFGREKGAYTGALTKMIGRFEAADKATLFLDEVGELPMEIQAKLLRVLEQGSFERLGSSRTIRVDVRIIAATNQNLKKLIAQGKFRKDLYYRLNIFPIHLPPLRNRIEDIPSLAWAFVREYEKKMGKRIDNIPARCMEALQQYPWPGNIRELRNLIERSLITCAGKTLQVWPPQANNREAYKDMTLEEIERRHITSVLEKARWRISGEGAAAGILGLKRTTLQSKMKKLGITKPITTADKTSP